MLGDFMLLIGLVTLVSIGVATILLPVIKKDYESHNMKMDPKKISSQRLERFEHMDIVGIAGGKYRVQIDTVDGKGLPKKIDMTLDESRVSVQDVDKWELHYGRVHENVRKQIDANGYGNRIYETDDKWVNVHVVVPKSFQEQSGVV